METPHSDREKYDCEKRYLYFILHITIFNIMQSGARPARTRTL